MMTWDDAIEEAKEELGIHGYTNNWDEVVETAKEILQQEKDDMSDDEIIEEEKIKALEKKERQDEYKEYLRSERWQLLRIQALERDKYNCKKCGTKATEVHHTRYDHIKTPWEIHCIISLCRSCHESEGRKQTIFR